MMFQFMPDELSTSRHYISLLTWHGTESPLIGSEDRTVEKIN